MSPLREPSVPTFNWVFGYQPIASKIWTQTSCYKIAESKCWQTKRPPTLDYISTLIDLLDQLLKYVLAFFKDRTVSERRTKSKSEFKNWMKGSLNLGIYGLCEFIFIASGLEFCLPFACGRGPSSPRFKFFWIRDTHTLMPKSYARLCPNF